MTYGYGPPPPEWQPGEGEGPPSRGRRRAQQQGGAAPSSPAGYGPYGHPDDPPPPRFPQPPAPARHLGGPGSARRPANGGSQPVGYPAYPPPVPTSPTVPRGVPPRPVGPRAPLPEPPTGRTRTGGFGPPRPAPAPGRPGRAPGRTPRRELPPLPTGPKVPRAVQLRNAVPGLIRHLPHHKPWMVALSAIAIVVVLGTCGLGSYLLFRDDRQLVALPDPTPTVAKRDITSRVTDPIPLTAADVFPGETIAAADASVPPYKRLGVPQVDTNCRLAATGDLANVLVAAGCNQFVRATFSSTDGGYLVTAGVFNLKDGAAADQAETQIRSIDASKGRLSGYISDKDKTIVFGRAATQVAWDADGHFLLYAVIARADGKEVAPSDPNISVIVYDVVEHYLRDHMIVEWSIDHSTPAPAGSRATGASPAAGATR